MLDRKYGTGADADKAIPNDEPVFILRAQDKASVKAILAYVVDCFRDTSGMVMA